MRVYPVINVVLAPRIASIPSSVKEVGPSRRSASFVSSPFVFVGLPDVRRFLFFISSRPLPNILRSDFGGLVDARKNATRKNLDSRGREVRPVSFSSDGTTVFVVVGGGSSAFAQSVAFWRWG